MKRKLFIGAILALCLLISGTLVGCTADSGVDEPSLDGGTQDGDETPSTDNGDSDNGSTDVTPSTGDEENDGGTTDENPSAGDEEDNDNNPEEETPSTGEEEQPQPVVVLSATTKTLYIEDVITLSYTLTNIEEGEIKYTVESGEEVVSVSDEGEVTALKVGTATVRGTIDGYEAYDEITFTVKELDEHIESLYSTIKSFDYEKGVTIHGDLSVYLGTLSIGATAVRKPIIGSATNVNLSFDSFDLDVTIPLDATFGYTSDDDFIAKISLSLDDIEGLKIPISISDFPIYEYDALSIIKQQVLPQIFTDITEDDAENADCINLYFVDGSENMYLELEGNSTTYAFYQYDLSGESSISSMFDSFNLDFPDTKDPISRGNFASAFELLSLFTDKTSDDTSMTLSLSSIFLEIIDVLYSSLEIGDMNFDEYTTFSVDDFSLYLVSYSNIVAGISGITFPEEITDLSLIINNDAEDDLKFSNIVLSVSGKTSTKDSYEFLTLTVERPVQLEDGVLSTLKTDFYTLVDTYLE